MAQLSHIDAQVLHMIPLVGTPDLLEQLPVRHHSSGMPDQGGEQLVFGRRKVGLHGAQEHLSPDQIHAELTGLKYWISTAPWGQRRVSERDPYPGKEFGNTEGFGEVVVGSQIQCCHFIMLLATSGDHNDRS